MKPRFNPEFNLGHVMSVLSAFVLVIGLYYGMKSEIRTESLMRESGDDLLAERMERLGDVLSRIEAEQRLNSDHRIRDEEHDDWK